MVFSSSSERVRSLLADLRISTTDYPTMIVAYKILRHLTTSCLVIDDSSVRQAMSTPLYQLALRQYPPNAAVAFSDANLATITQLCRIFRAPDLHRDYTAFFIAFCPALAADWSVIRSLEDNGVPVLDALYAIHIVLAATPKEELWNQDPYSFFFRVRQNCPSLQLAAYNQLLATVRGFDFTNIAKIEVSEHTEHALEQYAGRSAKKEDLLCDYLHLFPDPGITPIYFDQLDKKTQLQMKVAAPPKADDKSDTEDYFQLAQRIAAYALPSRVLTRLFYVKSSDPKVDCTISLRAFCNRIHTAKNPVVLIPSPAFLEAWTTAVPALPAISVVVPSRQIGLALSQEYHTLLFYSLSEACKTPLESDLASWHTKQQRSKPSILFWTRSGRQ